MLTDWYFCCCVGSDPHKTATFLLILEILNDNMASYRVKSLAFEELQKTEDWLQIYAIPASLRSVHHMSFDHWSQLYKFFDEILDLLPESRIMQDRYGRLLSTIINGESPSRDQIEACANEILRLPSRHSSPIPYLDLKDFLPETLILSILVEQLQHDSTCFTQVCRLLEESGSALSQVLDLTLTHTRGRMAFRLALQLSQMTSHQTKQTLLQACFKCDSPCITREPDIMEALVRIMFGSGIDSTPELARENATAVIAESLTLHQFRRLPRLDPQRKRQADALFHRVGLEQWHQSQTNTPPILYWQCALWDFATELDPMGTAEQLVRIWQAPQRSATFFKIHVRTASSSEEAEVWKWQLQGLLALREAIKGGVAVSIGTEYHIPTQEAWAFCSPWISLNLQSIRYNKTPSEPGKYPSRYLLGASHPLPLLRLLGCVQTAVKLLRLLPANHRQRTPFAALIAHTSDVLRETYRTTIKNDHALLDSLPLSLPLFGFAKYINRQLDIIGTGRLTSIPPTDFTQVLEEWLPLDRETNKLDERTYDEAIFLRRFLPETLLAWIEAAYTGAINQSEQSRWLPLIEKVYRYHAAFDKLPQSKTIAFLKRQDRLQVHAAVVVSFLCPQLPRNDSFDWCLRIEKGQYVTSDVLLLTERRLPISAWNREQWNERPQSGPNPGPEAEAAKRNFNLVRALERVAALGHASDTPAELAERWYREWFELFSAMYRSKDLSRYIRLRLTEFIDEPAIANLPEAQTLVALLLLEYGSPYELQRLLVRLFDNLISKSPISIARQQVCAVVIQSMWRMVISTRQATEYRLNLKDPYTILADEQKQSFIEEQLTCIAYWQRNTNILSFQKILHDLFDRASTESNHISAIEATIEFYDQAKVLIPRSDHPPFEDWMIESAVYNPNTLQMTLFINHMIIPKDVINLFTLSRQEVEYFYSNQSQSHVLAVLITIENMRPEEWQLTFHYGGTSYLEQRTQRLPEIERGTFVELPILRGPDGKWQIDSTQQIRPLSSRHDEGILKQVVIRELLDQNRHRQLQLSINNHVLSRKETKIPLWDPDTSRIYAQTPLDVPRTVIAQRKGNNWVPMQRGLIELVLHGFKYANGSIEVLTFIETITQPTGETGWLFARQPGEVYILYHHQFRTTAARKLTQEIHARRNSEGLLITFSLGFQDEKVILDLVSTDQVTSDLEERYPQLKAPFDTRNIQWRELFFQNEPPIAQYTSRGWVVVLEDPIPGFPAEVAVEWTHQIPPEVRFAELSVQRWDVDGTRRCVVCGDARPQHQITPHMGSWPNFLARWSKLQQGTRIMIVGIRSALRHHDSAVICETDEGVGILVSMRSLTMKLIDPRQRDFDIDIDPDGRCVEVTAVNWNTIDLRNFSHMQLPPELRSQMHVFGILVMRPAIVFETNALCQVIWQGSNDLRPYPLKLESSIIKRIRVGSKIIGSQGENGWSFIIQTPNIRAQALWTHHKWADSIQEATYLGMATFGSETVPLAELRTGEFAILPATPEGAQQLAKKQGNTYRNGLRSDTSFRDTSTGVARKLAHRWYRDAVLENQRHELLLGLCPDSTPHDNLILTHAHLTLDDLGDGFFRLERWLHLSQPGTDWGNLQAAENARLRQTRFDDYMANPVNLQATYDGRIVRLQNLLVPHAGTPGGWKNQLPVDIEGGPFMHDERYSSDALVRVFETSDGNFVASFRQVPPNTPEEFQLMLGVSFGIHYSLDKQLYYIGPERINPFNGMEFTEPYHRFEWGYGKTLLVAEKQLRYNGSQFSNAGILLYFGDTISGVTFIADEIQTSNEPEYQPNRTSSVRTIINIDTASLQFSQGHSLFLQRSQHKIVHILHLKLSKDAVHIEYVQGVHEYHLRENRHTFDRVQAKLDPSSAEALLSRANQTEHEDGSMIVLGRLQEDLFRASFGRIVSFEHVRLSFFPSEVGIPLMTGELVFLQIDRIIRQRNDIALKLKALEDLPPEDIGSDFDNLLLLRRRFSVREDLLYRIDRQGQHALSERILLVSLQQENSQIRPSLLHNIPSRKTQALASELALPAATILAIVVRRDENSIVFELKPGIFINLTFNIIELAIDEVLIGTVVRIQKIGNKFRIFRAAFSDMRYVTEYPRPAVAFPKNNLLSRSTLDRESIDTPNFWIKKAGFTIGGLSNINAIPGNWDSHIRVWSDPVPEKWIKLMQMEHPKLVLLGKDGQQRPRILPTDGSCLAGKIGIDLERHQPLFFPYPVDGVLPEPIELHWQLLSFADDSLKALLGRTKTSWDYHDQFSGLWTSRGTITPYEVPSHDTTTGPLFLERFRNNFILRYSNDYFLRFGFPVKELVRALMKKRGFQETYPVAGSTSDSLWIELSPGRIVEIPRALLVAYLEHREAPQDLSRLHCHAFAPGDQITLSLHAPDPLKIEQLALRDWRPGFRNILGNGGQFLPIHHYDSVTGALVLGVGIFTLTLPWSTSISNEKMAILTSDNILRPCNRLPQQGDVVLIGMNQESNVYVWGFPELIPLVNQRNIDAWDTDPLARIIFRRREFLQFDWNGLGDVLRATGGALPMTVEHVTSKGNIFLSLRLQSVATQIGAGGILPTRMLGVAKYRWALLRVGSGILPVKIDDVISGLPVQCVEHAAAQMRAENAIIWLKADADGVLSTGFVEVSYSEFLVKAITLISDSASQAQPSTVHTGIICCAINTGKYYWLPAEFAAWTRLTPAHLSELFLNSKRIPFRVRLVGRGSSPRIISIIHTLEKELRNLPIGKEIFVRVRLKIEEETFEPDKQRYLVTYLEEQYPTSKIILACETYHPTALSINETIAVEVIRRRLGPGASVRLTVTPLGMKQLKLDVPTWMQQDIPAIGKRRATVNQYLSWRNSRQTTAGLTLDESFDTVSNTELDQLLCYAYNGYLQSLSAGQVNSHDVETQISITQQWTDRLYARTEIPVALPLMAIVLFHENGSHSIAGQWLNREEAEALAQEWRTKAYHLFHHIGRRALRSLHVEVLASTWFYSQQARSMGDPLSIRLRQAEQELQSPMTPEKMSGLKQLSRAIELGYTGDSRNPDLIALAHAILAATGEPKNHTKLFQRADIIKTIIMLYRTLPPTTSGMHPPLHHLYIQEFRLMIDKILLGALDVTVLDPLPQIGDTDDE